MQKEKKSAFNIIFYYYFFVDSSNILLSHIKEQFFQVFILWTLALHDHCYAIYTWDYYRLQSQSPLDTQSRKHLGSP